MFWFYGNIFKGFTTAVLTFLNPECVPGSQIHILFLKDHIFKYTGTSHILKLLMKKLISLHSLLFRIEGHHYVTFTCSEL